MRYKYDNKKKDEHKNFINYLIKRREEGDIIEIGEITDYLDEVIASKKNGELEINENNIVKNINVLKENIIEYKDNLNTEEIKENAKNVIVGVQKVFGGFFGKKNKKEENVKNDELQKPEVEKELDKKNKKEPKVKKSEKTLKEE